MQSLDQHQLRTTIRALVALAVSRDLQVEAMRLREPSISHPYRPDDCHDRGTEDQECYECAQAAELGEVAGALWPHPVPSHADQAAALQALRADSGLGRWARRQARRARKEILAGLDVVFDVHPSERRIVLQGAGARWRDLPTVIVRCGEADETIEPLPPPPSITPDTPVHAALCAAEVV